MGDVMTRTRPGRFVFPNKELPGPRRIEQSNEVPAHNGHPAARCGMRQDARIYRFDASDAYLKICMRLKRALLSKYAAFRGVIRRVC